MITSKQLGSYPTLDKIIEEGYVEKRRVGDDTQRAWRVYENNEGGLIYDPICDKIVTQYKFEIWQKD